MKEYYRHYKTGKIYELMFVSKAGNKEDETIYYTYKPVDSDELYTRTKEDFFAQVGPSVTRFTKI